jgi:hypothetical protein
METVLAHTRTVLAHRPTRAAAAGAVLLALAGCRGCRESRPYVPYAIGSGGSTSAGSLAPARSGAPSPSDSGRFVEEPALVAPPDTVHWTAGGVTIDAPDGQVVVAASIGDFEASGAPDAFVLLGPADGAGPGALALYRPTQGPGAALTATATFAPPMLARGDGCTPVRRLTRIGRGTVLAELGASCPEQPSNAPARWVAIVDAAGGGNVRLAATIADPTGAPALQVSALAGDRDGDGRDDFVVEVAIEGGGAPLEPGPHVAAALAFFDRPAGLSRDAGATDASFGALAAAATSRASRSREAAEVPAVAAQVRALWRAVCSDGGSPRVVPVAGTGAITCGASRALEEVGLAEVRAYATLGDPLRASLAFDRSQLPPSTHTPARIADAKKWISQLAPFAAARLLRSVAAVPVAPRAREIAWGALAFEPSGKLLVKTRAGVVRVDPDLGDESSAGTPDWPSAVTSPDGGLRWTDAFDPCDGLPLRATFELASGSDDRDIALPVPAPPSARCAGGHGAPVRVNPVAWGPRGLEAFVETEPVFISNDLSQATPVAAFLDQPPVAGAPRSPDGKRLVVPSGFGFVVRGGARARVLRASELDGTYGDQRECVVSSDETHVGCVREGRAWVGTWDAP